MSTYFFSVVITMSEQLVLSAVAQCITVTFLTNVNAKSAEILMRLLRAQIGDKTFSRTQGV